MSLVDTGPLASMIFKMISSRIDPTYFGRIAMEYMLTKAYTMANQELAYHPIIQPQPYARIDAMDIISISKAGN